MAFATWMEPLLQGQSLTDADARAMMTYMTSGEATEAQIGAFATAMRIKGGTGQELAAFAGVLRSQAEGPEKVHDDLVDTCGTGGGVPSFNISTAAAFIAAGAGVRIGKHGNRGVTSPCGSADVLEALGAKIQTTWDHLLFMLDTVRIGFLYAPAHHPGLKHAGKARRELGFRTVFNQLGPLASPVDARYQLVGVYSPALCRPMAEALGRLGTQRALVVHGDDGLDEVSPAAPTRYALLWDGELSEGIITPQGFGIKPVESALIQPGTTIQESASKFLEAVKDVDSPLCSAILPSAACALWICGAARDRLSATEMARQAVLEGKAAAKLEEFIEVSHKGE